MSQNSNGLIAAGLVAIGIGFLMTKSGASQALADVLTSGSNSGGGPTPAGGIGVTGDFNQWDPILRAYGNQYSVPWRWLKAFDVVESQLGSYKSVRQGIENPNDVDGSISDDGKSWGIAQLTLTTASALNGASVTPQELNDVNFSTELQARLVKQLIYQFGIDDKEGVARAYNGGPNYGAATLPYWVKWQAALSTVLAKNPGDELEGYS